MSFLNNTGLAYFYSKLKEKFIQTVNGSQPDTHGNVQINKVSLAENLTSPDAQASVDNFIYRASGGSASLESGEANLIFINGNMVAGSDRKTESWTATTSNGLICNINNIDKETWRDEVSTTSTTTFTYSTTITDEDVQTWTSTPSWSPSLSTYGMSSAISGVINYSIASINSSDLQSTIKPTTFSESDLGATSGEFVFTYIIYEDNEETQSEDESENTGWYYGNTKVDLGDYGITLVSGTPGNRDTITIDWTIGTPSNTTVVIEYVAPAQGTLHVATPVAFQSTGFNQFDKTSMVINNATISGTSIVSDSNNHMICYCPAKGGDHGYAAVSPGNHIDNTAPMGWCATIPTIGSTVTTTSININDSVTDFAGRFTAAEDGYILVVVDSAEDLMMGCAWTDYISDIQEALHEDPSFYVEYTPPSQIPIPTSGYDDENQLVDLPTATYGLPRLGNVYDTINFDANTYIQRIGYMPYTASNLITVKNWYTTYGTPYDYDEGVYDGDTKIRDGYIFYVLDGNIGVGSSITYTLDVTSIYQVDDHGTEKFTGTTVPVEAELLYGQNLRDKLRSDVITISEQELLPSQQTQVRTNIQAAPTPLLFTNVAVDSSAFASDSTYDAFDYCGTISLPGVTSNMIPYVAFDGNEASSGDYCPTVNTYDGGIQIYAAASDNIIIPTILCWRVE